jgi:hypothetical protein
MVGKAGARAHVVIYLAYAVLLLALALRLAYFGELRDMFPGFLESKPFCGLDGNAYQGYALGFLKGTWPGDQGFAHMILYPFYLSLIYSLVGVSLQLAVVVQIILEVVACAALYGIGRLAFSRPVGLLTSLLFAIYGPLIFFNPCFAQVTLTIPLFTLALFLLLKAHSTKNTVYLFLAAVLTGLAALSRPTFVILVPIVLYWLFLNRTTLRHFALQGALFAGVVFLVMLPVALYNYRVEGRFSPTPNTGWEILFLGNNPVAEGMGTIDYVLYTYLDLPGESYVVSVFDTAKQSGPRIFRDEVIRFVTTDSLDWLKLTWRKTYLLMAETDDRLVSPYFVHNLQSVSFLQYSPLTWRSVLIAAIIAVLLVKHRHRSLVLLLLVSLILFTIAFHIQFRFRLFLVPLVLLYAAVLIVAAPRLGKIYLSLVLIVLGGLLPFLPELGWTLMLFIASALMPFVRCRDWYVVRWAGLAAWSYLVVALLIGQVISFAGQAGQRQTIFLGPQVAGSVALGQSFVVNCNGFNRLSLVLGTFGDRHHEPVTLHLRAGPDQPDDIYRVTFDVIGTKDRTRRDFSFPAQPESAHQSYFLFIDAPSANPEEAITLRGTYDKPFDRYRVGTAYAGQPGAWQELSADMAFNAYCDTGPLDLVSQAFQQVAARTGGTTVTIWALMIAHVGLLILALLKLWNR